jgi:hypothetical protein
MADVAMETTTQPPPSDRRPMHPGRVSGGAVLMAMGIVMLLDRTELLGGRAWQAFPGAILIMFGLIGMVTNWRRSDERRGSPLSGLWLIFVGSWLIGNSFHAFGMRYQHSWPLLIVAAGTVIVLKELFPGQPSARRRENS